MNKELLGILNELCKAPGWLEARHTIAKVLTKMEADAAARFTHSEHIKAFNDEMIRRSGLPGDVMGLIHDLCYHHNGRNVQDYVMRAQEILKSPTVLPQYCTHHFHRHGWCMHCGFVSVSAQQRKFNAS